MTEGEAAARDRLDRLFAAFDRLTPDELARIGYRPRDEAERDELLDAVDEAARRTGREALVDGARLRACETVMARYAAGTLHSTWVALNWGVSQGTVEDRVAIVEALADAAAAAVVEDALEPDAADALAIDARRVVGLSTGAASDGALARALRRPDDPDLGPSRAWYLARLALAGGLVLVVPLGGLLVALAGLPAVLAVAFVVAALVAGWLLPRRTSG